METIEFTCIKVHAGSNKAALKPDADGYYCDVVVGAFDLPNAHGETYPMNPVKEMMSESSRFMRRIKAGYLVGAWGHPERQAGESDLAFMNRAASIHESTVSHQFRKIKVTKTKDKKTGKPYFIVKADVKPFGPNGHHVKEGLENPHLNMGFSIRCFFNRVMKGIVEERHIADIITWDAVIEPGIHRCNKYDGIGMESLQTEVIDLDRLDTDTVGGVSIGMESASIDVNALRASVRRTKGVGRMSNVKKPASLDW